MSLHDSRKEATAVAESTSSQDQLAEESCQLAKELEDAGDYDGAAKALGQFWRGVGVRPPIAELDLGTQAEVLLRVGTLTGWLGMAQAVEHSLEKAKNLLSESIRKFESLGQVERAAEAQAELGMCYVRAGDNETAEIYFQNCLQRLQNSQSILKGITLLRLASVSNNTTRFHDALNYLTEAEPIIAASKDPQLLGRFNTKLGITLEHLSESVNRMAYLKRALTAYTNARDNFKRANHFPFIGASENNLGLIYLALQDYSRSHFHLNRAQRIFTELNDRYLITQVQETRARVFLAQGKNIMAARLAGESADTLEQLGDHLGDLARALITRGRALARIGNIEWALSALRRAHEIAWGGGDRECAGDASLVLIEELNASMTAGELLDCYLNANELLKASQHFATLTRIRGCGITVAERSKAELGTPQFSPVSIITPGKSINLVDEVNRYEGALVLRAMDISDYKVLRASRLLGLNSHQTLLAMLNGRHLGLIPEEKRRTREASAYSTRTGNEFKKSLRKTRKKKAA